MIVLTRIIDLKLDFDPLIKRVTPRGAVVRAGFEPQAIQARRERVVSEQLFDAPVLIRNAMAELDERPILEYCQADAHRSGWFAERGIEHVRGDRAHDSSFSSRRWVIFACSVAAMSSSKSGECLSRAWSNESISSALFPVAQTMNEKPKRSR